MEFCEGNLCLSGERRVMSDGRQGWTGGLLLNSRPRVIPGRTLVWSVEACGAGTLETGFVEFGDPYTPLRGKVIARKSVLRADWRTIHLRQRVSPAAACVAPFVRVSGWRGLAKLRMPRLSEVVRAGTLSIETKEFVYCVGRPVELFLSSDSRSVLIVVSGPSGVPPGPGGEYGGADAWVDHPIFSLRRSIASGIRTKIRFNLPQPVRAGFYRVTVVQPSTGQSAEARFAILAPDAAHELRCLSRRIKLPPHSRIAFVGDSLTALFPGRNYLELVRSALGLGNDAAVFDSGIGGNNILDIEKRLDEDVFSLHPTLIFLFEGTNDCKRPFQPGRGLSREWIVPKAEYEKALRRVCTRLAASGARVVLITAVPGDQRLLRPFRRRAEQTGQAVNFIALPGEIACIGRIQRRFAREYGFEVLDMQRHFLSILGASEDPEYLHVDDGIHLSESGNREVAFEILRFLARKPLRSGPG